MGHDEADPEAPINHRLDKSPEAMAERFILSLRQLILHRRREATSRQLLRQGWQGR